jgi:hypothetical protein
MLPERINVMKVISYDTQHYLADVALRNDISEDEVTSDMLLDWLTEWVLEDFDVVDYNGLIFQDENGKEL